MDPLPAPGPPYPSDVVVELTGVGKRFDRKWVVKDITGRLTSGSVLGIAGPNGSGKSTLVKMIATLLHPDRGSISISADGRPLDWHERRRYIGWVSPDTGLYRALTGAEHVRFFARLHGLADNPEAVLSALDGVGLHARPGLIVGAYSSGMAQRLRYACATLHQPPILLLDEPHMALDAEGLRMVRRVVEQQRRRGVCIVAGNRDDELALADSVLRIGSDGA